MFILVSTPQLYKLSECLISALTQGVGGRSSLGSLVQLCRGKGGTLQTISLACVGIARSVEVYWVAPHDLCVFNLHCSDSRLPCRRTVQSGPWVVSLPRSKLSRFRLLGTPQGTDSFRKSCSLYCLLSPQHSSGEQMLGDRTFPAGLCILSLLVQPPFLRGARSCLRWACISPLGELISGCSPSSWMSAVQDPGKLR